jgi:hypothetical protein
MNFDMESITKGIGIVTATLALVGGGYSLYDKLGIEDPILKWAPEHFSISDGPVDGEFRVIVAREKLRDDCKVTGFKLEIRDSEYIVHPAKSSIATFSGPANNKVDKFGYKVSIAHDHSSKVAKGEATLLAHIDYECPEGPVIVNYPDHKNLRFNIE